MDFRCQECSWVGSKGTAARCQSSYLKQQAKNERVTPLITYGDGISKRLKSETALPLRFHFSPWDDAPVDSQVDQHRRSVVSRLRKPQQDSGSLRDCGVEERERGKDQECTNTAGGGGTELEEGQMFQVVLLSPVCGTLSGGA